MVYRKGGKGKRIPRCFARKVGPPLAESWGQTTFQLTSREPYRLNAGASRQAPAGGSPGFPPCSADQLTEHVGLSGRDAHHSLGGEFITPNETFLPGHLTAPLSARGDTRKQQRHSEAGDQKFLPSFEVSVFLCCFGREKKKPHSPQEGHNTQGLLFFFPTY